MEIAVIGAGGHSKVIQEIIRSREDCNIKAILDDKYTELICENGVYKGPVSSAQVVLELIKDIKFVVAIGNNKIRKLIVSKLALSNENYISLIHESAVISPSASIGYGTVVMANAVVNADASVGDHAIINTGAIVEHDNQISDFVHIAPKAALTGAVRVDEGTMIGAGATVIPGVAIGEWAIIGAGATVIEPIPPGSTAVGTPAKIIKKANQTPKSA